MEEVKRQSAELHARRRAQEKVLNDMFSQLIEQELKREGEKFQDNKVYLLKFCWVFRKNIRTIIKTMYGNVFHNIVFTLLVICQIV